ncbi:MAG: pyrroline-5-carboxylate reductase [Pseudomonadota bacterium]
MDFSKVNQDGLVMLGCGKMGSAMLQGWLSAGMRPTAISVIDPEPSDWLQTQAQLGLTINEAILPEPAVVVLAVKPQIMFDALPRLDGIGGAETLFLSIAGGIQIAALVGALGDETAIMRAMPNTPAAIGKGITAFIGNAYVTDLQVSLGEALLSAIGQTVQLETEEQMDAVTAVSGSGPAYVFHMIEALTVAGMAEGLPEALAHRLALATVDGAGALAALSEESPSQLRVNVTSPNGTTQAGLEVLMDDDTGLPPLMNATVKAAAKRSRELGA